MTNFSVYDLAPTNGQRSFYGKARVHVYDDGAKELYSYDTLIMRIEADGTMRRFYDGYTHTTGKHIKAFCGLRKADFEKLPLDS